MSHERLGLAFLLAHRPRPAVHLDEHRSLGVAGEVRALPHVETVAYARVAVTDVAAGPVAVARSHVGLKQLPPAQRHLRPRREGLTDAGAVVGPELVHQRRFEHCAGLRRRLVDGDESGRRRRRRRRGPACPAIRACLLPRQQRCGGELEHAGLQRQLGGSEPEGERGHRQPSVASDRAEGIGRRSGRARAGDEETRGRLHGLSLGSHEGEWGVDRRPPFGWSRLCRLTDRFSG